MIQSYEIASDDVLVTLTTLPRARALFFSVAWTVDQGNWGNATFEGKGDTDKTALLAGLPTTADIPPRIVAALEAWASSDD